MKAGNKAMKKESVCNLPDNTVAKIENDQKTKLFGNMTDRDPAKVVDKGFEGKSTKVDAAMTYPAKNDAQDVMDWIPSIFNG